MVYCWFFCSSWRWSSVFLSWHCHFLFVLLIVYLAGISSPSCSKSFEYFLPPVISHFSCLPCLRKKYVCLDINLGIWPTVTESLKNGSLTTSAHLSIKIILVDLNLVRTFSGHKFFKPNYGPNPCKWIK